MVVSLKQAQTRDAEVHTKILTDSGSKVSDISKFTVKLDRTVFDSEGGLRQCWSSALSFLLQESKKIDQKQQQELMAAYQIPTGAEGIF